MRLFTTEQCKSLSCPVHELHRYRASAHTIRVTWPLGLRISKYIQKNLDTYRINLSMVWVQTSSQLVKCKNSNKPLKVSAQHNFQLRENKAWYQTSLGHHSKAARIRELKHARFWDADGNRKWAVFTFNFSSHNHIHIAKYLFSTRDG